MDRKPHEKLKDSPRIGEPRPKPWLRLVSQQSKESEPRQQKHAVREGHPNQTFSRCWDDDDPGPTAA